MPNELRLHQDHYRTISIQEPVSALNRHKYFYYWQAYLNLYSRRKKF